VGVYNKNWNMLSIIKYIAKLSVVFRERSTRKKQRWWGSPQVPSSTSVRLPGTGEDVRYTIVGSGITAKYPIECKRRNKWRHGSRKGYCYVYWVSCYKMVFECLLALGIWVSNYNFGYKERYDSGCCATKNRDIVKCKSLRCVFTVGVDWFLWIMLWQRVKHGLPFFLFFWKEWSALKNEKKRVLWDIVHLYFLCTRFFCLVHKGITYKWVIGKVVTRIK
jgi:hypothetical protein